MSRLVVAVITAILAAGSGTAQRAWAGDVGCRTKVDLLTLADALPMTRHRLAEGIGLVIVAIGSSSTAGHGASAPDRRYPAQLGALLRAHYPKQTIEVLNRGVGGETAAQMVARFDRDVVAHRPHLVLWQTGANDAMRGVDPDEFAATIDHGLALLRAHRLDVVLIVPQYAPKLLATPKSEIYRARMHEVAARRGVPVFRRHSIMRELATSRPDALRQVLSPDGLHLNDIGYRCLAIQLTTAIEANAAAAPRVLDHR